MGFDLRGALLKKQEIETSRLLDFEFRRRARAMKLISLHLGLEPGTVVARIVHEPDAGIVSALAAETGVPRAEMQRLLDRCAAEAHAQLVEELGDPTPFRLA